VKTALNPTAVAWTPGSGAPPGQGNFAARPAGAAGQQQQWQRRDGAAPQGTPQTPTPAQGRHFPGPSSDQNPSLARQSSLPATPLPSMGDEKYEDPTQSPGSSRYSKQEFVDFYGPEKGDRYWNKAKAGEKYPKKPAPERLPDCTVRHSDREPGKETLAHRFEVDRKSSLGEGAFAQVYAGRDLQMQEDVAVKVIMRHHGSSGSEVEMEVALLKLCQHPNVVALVAAYASPREYFLVLERLWRDLGSLIKEAATHRQGSRALDEDQARMHFRGILSGLQALHAAGICHRDLKPENCLVTHDKPPVIKLTDLGISSWYREPEQRCGDKGVGTVYYCAPEVIVGDYDAFAADVWSAGAVLFVMLTARFAVGSPKMGEKEVESLLQQHKLNRIPDYVSSSARDLIKSLLVPARHVKDRLKLEGIIAHPWVRWNEMDQRDAGKDPIAARGAGTLPDSDSEEQAAFGARGGRGGQARRGRQGRNGPRIQDGGRQGGRGGLSSHRTKS